MLWLAWTRTAAGQPGDDLHAVRDALASYDLQHGGALAGLQQLRALAASADGPRRSELRFLDAALASDLLFAAALGDHPGLAEQVAAAFAVKPDKLVELLVAELGSITDPRFTRSAAEASEVLARLREGPALPFRETKLASPHKRDLLFAWSLRASLRSEATQQRGSEAGLAQLMPEPCTLECAEPYLHFDAEGRRATSALIEAGRSLARLRQVAAEDDPLVAAVTPELTDLEAQLLLVTLRPMPRLEGVAGSGAEPVRDMASPEIVLVVGEDGVRFSFVPTVQLAASGEAVLSGGLPSFPAADAIALPKLSAYLVPFPELTHRLHAELAREPKLRVGVALRAGTEADLLARVLISVRRIGCEEVMLLGAASQGSVTGAPVALLSKLESEQAAPAALSLEVRPSGYAWRVDGAVHHSARGAEGDRHSELQALAVELAAQPVAIADVSFMLRMNSDVLTEAVFGLANAARTTRLRLPPSALDQSTEFKRSLRESKQDAVPEATPPG